MEIGVSARRRSVLALFITLGFVALSCSDRESPTSPSRSSTGMAAVSGTLLAASDAPAGRGGAAAGEPLAGVTVRAVSSGQTTRTDSAGRFTLAGLTPGSVTLQFSGAGIQASATVPLSAGQVAIVTVTANRGRSTVMVSPRGTEGTISGITAPNFTVMNPRGSFTIVTGPSTQFRMNDATVTFSDLKVGQQVEVEGSPQPDGSILAVRVEIENPEQETTRTPNPALTGTRTPEPDDEDRTRTPNPTVTGTPPTRTPEPEETPRPTLTGIPLTRTPEPEETRRPTLTGTPPTRTPEPEDSTISGTRASRS